MRTSSRGVTVVLFDEVELLDVAAVVSVLTTAGRQWNYRPFKITTAASKPGLVPTRSQTNIEASRLLGSVAQPEIVVVPGGYGARRALDDAALVEWLAKMGTLEHLVAVGNGALLLAKAGLLADRDVAARGDTKELLAALEPTARIDETSQFRESRGTITAATSLAGIDAALFLVEKILGKKQAAQVAFGLGAPYAPSSVDLDLLRSK
jgi:transcriptional regulator GlxA family with amidase domain